MLERKESLHKKQSKEHPKIETIIELLDGDLKQSITDFVAYCKTVNLSCSWGSSNKWYLKYKGKRIGTLEIRIMGMDEWRVKFKENSWNISNVLWVNAPEYVEFIENEGLANIIKKNVKRCEGCLTTCAPGSTMTILGEEFDHVCVGKIRFVNPDGESLRCIKKLLDFRKSLIVNGEY